MLKASVLEKLRTFDTPTICNIIELFDVRPRNAGYMDARIKACFPEMPPMVGFASTATFRADAPATGADGYATLISQIERFGELLGPPVVVFQDLDDPAVAATFGEVMCTAYKVYGAVGLITSGASRDLDQVRALGFPAFANGSICSHGYFYFGQLHVPVRVGGLTVFPDDLLHGDCNGVTNIPKEIADEVAEVGDEFVAAESLVLNALKDRKPTLHELAEVRAEAGEVFAAIRARVSRAK